VTRTARGALFFPTSSGEETREEGRGGEPGTTKEQVLWRSSNTLISLEFASCDGLFVSYERKTREECVVSRQPRVGRAIEHSPGPTHTDAPPSKVNCYVSRKIRTHSGECMSFFSGIANKRCLFSPLTSDL
jgi:hypothetical protein